MQTSSVKAKWPAPPPWWRIVILSARAGGVALEYARCFRFRRSQTGDPVLALKLRVAEWLAPGPISGEDFERRCAAANVGIDRAKLAARSIGAVYFRGEWNFPKAAKSETDTGGQDHKHTS